MLASTLNKSVKGPVSRLSGFELLRDRWRWLGPAVIAIGGGLGLRHYLHEVNNGRTVMSDAYANDTPLTWILGNGPEVAVIAALISERRSPVSDEDLARLAGVENHIVRNHLDVLADYGIVEVSDGCEYKLNLDHDVAKYLVRMEDSLVTQWYEEYEAGERSLS